MSEVFPESPLTSLPAAVAAMGAFPVPVGPQQPPFPPAPRTFEEKLRQDAARLQGLLAEAVRDAHRARSERDLIRERVSEPFGCKHCGVEKRSHGRRYIGGQGMHAWERPSDEQVKARMLARRVARSPLPAVPELEQLKARVAELEHTVQQMVEGLNGHDCPPPDESPLDTVTRWMGYLDTAEARVAALLAERHSTNESVSDAAEALRARPSCPCPPENPPAPHQVGCFFDGVPVSPPSERPVVSSREEPHDSPLHHPYTTPHDLDMPTQADPGERLLEGDELRRELRGHLFGGGA